MHSVLATLGLVGLAAAFPQGVTAPIAPTSPAPAGCSKSHSGTFQITTYNVTNSKRDLESRQTKILTLSLTDSVLKDQDGRIGYIADNFQFQFDAPPQAGAIYTSGFSLCGNNSLALGGSVIFYQCYSGGFYNLYDRHWAAQCSPIYIEAMGSAPASVAPDGQPAVTGAASQLPDGQPQATPISQLSDGQPQGPKATPISQLSDGQPQAPSATGKPVSQLTDGQPQAPKATTKAPVSQLSDGQPQAPKATKAPVSQLSDGQPQAPKATASPVTQISDGQIQATAGAKSNISASSTPVAFTGAASYITVGSGVFTGLVGLLAAMAML